MIDGLPQGIGVPAIALRTILVSGAATALAILAGVPLGYVIARRNFPGRTLVLGFINTGMGMPPVVPEATVDSRSTPQVARGRTSPGSDWPLLFVSCQAARPVSSDPSSHPLRSLSSA